MSKSRAAKCCSTALAPALRSWPALFWLISAEAGLLTGEEKKNNCSNELRYGKLVGG